MSLKAIRFCHVAEASDAAGIANVLGDGLGLKQSDLGMSGEGFSGAVFPSADGSWVEVWPAGEGMPAGTMLQLVVDDADAYAEKRVPGDFPRRARWTRMASASTSSPCPVACS